MAEYGKGYGKRPLWQWVLIYVVVGGIVYGLVYYFVLAKKGANYGSAGTNNIYRAPTPTQAPAQTAPPTNSGYGY